MRLFNQRDGILSLADARRDANLSRVGARDQYETDVADFKDSFVTDLEKDFMSSGDTYMNPSNILPPSIPLDIPQEEIFLPPRFIEEDFFEEDPIYTPPDIDFRFPRITDDRIVDTPPPLEVPPPFFIDEPIDVPPTREIDFRFPRITDDRIVDTPPPLDVPPPLFIDELPIFKPPVDNIYDDVINDINLPPTLPPMRPPGDGRNPPIYDDIINRPYEPPIDDKIYDEEDKDGPYDPPYDPPYVPPSDPPYTPPIDTPAPRRMYRPPTDFSSGVPQVQLPRGVNVGIFGQAPGFEPPPPPRIIKERRLPPPPPDRPTGGNFSIQRIDEPQNNLKFGGPLNAGIMKLPQSQQGDTMTTRIFQNAFKPRR